MTFPLFFLLKNSQQFEIANSGEIPLKTGLELMRAAFLQLEQADSVAMADFINSLVQQVYVHLLFSYTRTHAPPPPPTHTFRHAPIHMYTYAHYTHTTYTLHINLPCAARNTPLIFCPHLPNNNHPKHHNNNQLAVRNPTHPTTTPRKAALQTATATITRIFRLSRRNRARNG